MNDQNTISRHYPDRPYLAASIAVFRNGKVLLTSRCKPPYENCFSLPGGLVETGEGLQEAAARELMEEVGIEATLPIFVGPVEIIDHDATGRIQHHAVVMVHTAFWKAGKAQTGPEAGQILWVGIEELESLPTTPGLKDILLQCQSILGENPSSLV